MRVLDILVSVFLYIFIRTFRLDYEYEGRSNSKEGRIWERHWLEIQSIRSGPLKIGGGGCNLVLVSLSLPFSRKHFVLSFVLDFLKSPASLLISGSGGGPGRAPARSRSALGCFFWGGGGGGGEVRASKKKKPSELDLCY